MEALTEIAGKIGFDWRIALSHTINIGIIFILLVKFALPKIKQIINERTEKIKQGLKNKEESESMLLSAKSESETIIKAANKEKQEIINKADDLSKANISKSEKEASEIIEKVKEKEKGAEKAGFDSGINLLENKIGDILSILSDKAFAGKVDAKVEGDFIKTVFEQIYAKR